MVCRWPSKWLCSSPRESLPSPLKPQSCPFALVRSGIHCLPVYGTRFPSAALPCIQSDTLFSPVTPSHVHFILKPGRQTKKGREKFFPPLTLRYLFFFFSCGWHLSALRINLREPSPDTQLRRQDRAQGMNSAKAPLPVAHGAGAGRPPGSWAWLSPAEEERD